MKSTLIALILLIACSITYGQSSKVKKMMKEIEGEWSLDDNRNVTYQLIIEVPEMSKEEIYNRALNYFVYNYGSAEAVIQTQNKEKGEIIGKGLYDEVHRYTNGSQFIYISTYHILRVNTKEGRARILLTLTEYSKYFEANSSSSSDLTKSLVSQEYPINIDGGKKTIMGKAFYYSHLQAIGSLNGIEKAIKEGNTSKKIEDSEW